ncbi:uncharacterized protein LOC135224033 [Macrobrachium nipponense]|uniref:uncharacterized protein LOC135224033 n=1 Tax=Macrobrachium nipponense TaxID=159736 RepID=UPI0030C7AF83
MLKKTYADPEKITSSLICQVAGLPKPSADLDSLRGFRAKLEQYVRGIERNKPNLDHCTWILGPLVFQKLPGKVKEQIQNKCEQDYPSLLDIREGLGKIILTLSSLDFEPSDKNKDYSHRKPKHNQSSNRPGNQTKTQVSSYTPKKNDVTNLSISVTPGQPIKTARTQSCVFCDRPEHKAYQCDIYKTTQECISRLTAQNHCVKCTSPNHKTTDCLVKFHKCLSCNTKELRSLFDSGAQRTFITQEAVEECKLVRDNPVQLSISGFWDTKEPREYSKVTVPVRVNDDSLVNLKAIVVPKLPQSTRPRGLCEIVSELKSQKVTLADPNLSSSQIDQVKLLVGIDHYFDFIHSPQANGVNLIESSLGYLVAGKLPSNDTPISTHSVTVMRLAVDEPSKAAL